MSAPALVRPAFGLLLALAAFLLFAFVETDRNYAVSTVTERAFLFPRFWALDNHSSCPGRRFFPGHPQRVARGHRRRPAVSLTGLGDIVPLRLVGGVPAEPSDTRRRPHDDDGGGARHRSGRRQGPRADGRQRRPLVVVVGRRGCMAHRRHGRRRL